LTLSARKLKSPLANHRFIPIGQFSDEFIGPRDMRSLFELGLGGIGTAETQIFSHRSRKEKGFLAHISNVGPKTVDGDTGQGISIHQDLSGLRVVIAKQEFDHGGFPGSGGSHNSQHLAEFKLEV